MIALAAADFGRHPVTTLAIRHKQHTAQFFSGAFVTSNPNRTAMIHELDEHVNRLRACRRCPHMHSPAVSGGPVLSKVMLVGQAPGDKEPILGRPFAWTAGKTLFKWFHESGQISEAQFRREIYMAAVCRCFPGKKPAGGDRVPSDTEIENCWGWFESELEILRPALVVPVGKLAIERFLPMVKLDRVVGRQFGVNYSGRSFDLIPLPHPSGASPWHRMEPGKTLLQKALTLIAAHPAFRELTAHRRDAAAKATI